VDPGAEDVVVVPNDGQRRLQVGGIDRAVEVIGGTQVERRVPGIKRLEDPQVPLGGTQPYRL
jgi:hypothetical protein